MTGNNTEENLTISRNNTPITKITTTNQREFNQILTQPGYHSIILQQVQQQRVVSIAQASVIISTTSNPQSSYLSLNTLTSNMKEQVMITSHRTNVDMSQISTISRDL